MAEIPSKISFDQINQSLERIKSFNNFLIFGAEPFQKNQSLSILMKLFNINEIDNFDIFLVYGDEYSSKANPISSMTENLYMMPFAQEKKILIIKNFDEMNADNQEQVVKYLNKSSKDSILILTADKLDSRTSRAKKITDHCFSIECKEIKYPSVFIKWVSDEIRNRKIQIDESAKMALISSIDMDFYTAYNELNKLLLFTGGNRRITIDDVKNCTAKSKTHTVFELIDEIGYKRTDKAIIINDNLLDNLESQILIITMITNLFMTLWRLSALKEKNISDTEIKERYMKDIIPFARDKYFAFLRNYNHNKIKKALDLLLETDRQAKLSMAGEYVLLDTLIYKICNL
jgi:DNA polymerase-3 subunit delta